MQSWEERPYRTRRCLSPREASGRPFLKVGAGGSIRPLIPVGVAGSTIRENNLLFSRGRCRSTSLAAADGVS